MLWGQSFICFHNAKEESDAKFRGKEIGPDWPILKRWDVPWKWQTVLLIMASCGLSFVLTGLVEVALTPYLGFQIGELSLDEKAEVLFVDQAITTALVLGVVYGLTNTFQPLPDNLFCYMVDAPVSLLPLIGSSNISTACLVGITGVLAPLLEETVFRGFFMASLTKWFPAPVSVILSAAVFALFHLTPERTALGLSYAQTRNLLTPISIHALWNSEVILVLTFLQLQGYDIKELLQAS